MNWLSDKHRCFNTERMHDPPTDTINAAVTDGHYKNWDNMTERGFRCNDPANHQGNRTIAAPLYYGHCYDSMFTNILL